MKQASEWALALVAVILTYAFLAGVAGGVGWTPGRGAPAIPDNRYFHAGKMPPASLDERGCLSTGCHAGGPHAKDRTQAAFRNMHVRFIDCLVCHGRESRTSWNARPPAAGPKPGPGQGAGLHRNRWTITAPTPSVDGEKMHALVGRAVSCRACHSEQGYRELTGMGIRDLSPGFANPVALRMIEEGAKQWIPDTLR